MLQGVQRVLARLAVGIYLPRNRLKVWLVGFVLLAAAVVWLPWAAMTGYSALSKPQTTALKGLPELAAYTRAEGRLAERLLGAGHIPSGNLAFPIWRLPADSYVFAINGAGSAYARAAVQSVERAHRFRLEGKFDEAAAHQGQASSSLRKLREAQGGASRRGADYYYSGLVALWEGAPKEAVSAFQGLETNITSFRNDTRPAAGSINARRLDAMEVVALYGIAHARLAGGGLVNAEERRGAIGQLRDALDKAKGLVGETSGPFATFNGRQHLVDMTTAPIWNDLIVAIMTDEGVGRARDLARPLASDQTTLLDNPELASNLLVVLTVTDGGKPLVGHREMAASIWPDAMWDSPMSVDVRKRAAAAFHMLGLQAPQIGDPSFGEAQSPVRSVFKTMFSSLKRFEAIDLPDQPQSRQQVDGWLFINAWRELLRNGQVCEVKADFDLLKQEPIDMGFFNEWRGEVFGDVMKSVDDMSNQPLLGNEQRDNVFHVKTHCNPNATFVGVTLDVMRYSFGNWWIASVLLWLLVIGLAVVALVVLAAYIKANTPAHHVARMSAKKT